MSDAQAKIQQECKAASMKLAAVVMRIDATQKLFDSAAFMGLGQEADKFRQELHALLDERLDHNARVMQLTRQLMEL